MSVPAHPLLGDYAFNKFGATGFALCLDGSSSPTREHRIAVNALTPNVTETLVIDDHAPEDLTRSRFGFSGISMSQIERMLTAFYWGEPASFYISGPSIGQVQHVIGREGEDYIGQGSTSQEFENCSAEVAVDRWGITLDFSGALARKGFLGEVVPSLFKPAYAVRCRMTWQVARFYFSPNTIILLYERFATAQE